ncbi:L-threonylcarbamoyladenylate synthase [Guyparkeria sp.]|uniref:L-threonylcarbamoyladenylate synthase n=1 Tax=Guyparkeria sp. TaxID=2035736 RepID=UPI0035629CEE
MTTTLDIHPETPQPRLAAQAAKGIAAGQVVVVPTDSGYALACRLEDKDALARIARIRRDDGPHHMTLSVRDLSELGVYAKVDNIQFRFLKNHTPGPYTFILPATREVPRRLLHEKKRSIGLRMPEHRVLVAILEQLDAPILSASLAIPDIDEPLDDPELFPDSVRRQVDLIASAGFCEQLPSTVLDLTGEDFTVEREGLGGVPPELAE